MFHSLSVWEPVALRAGASRAFLERTWRSDGLGPEEVMNDLEELIEGCIASPLRMQQETVGRSLIPKAFQPQGSTMSAKISFIFVASVFHMISTARTHQFLAVACPQGGRLCLKHWLGMYHFSFVRL